jgi:hypothetical protein
MALFEATFIQRGTFIHALASLAATSDNASFACVLHDVA